MEDLSIYNNHALNNLTGLEGLITIDGTLTIGFYYGNGNWNLSKFDGVEQFNHHRGKPINRARNLYQFRRIRRVDFHRWEPKIGDIDEGGNSNLINLTGLNGLTTIEGELHIYANNSLTSLTGLENVNYIGGTI